MGNQEALAEVLVGGTPNPFKANTNATPSSGCRSLDVPQPKTQQRTSDQRGSAVGCQAGTTSRSPRRPIWFPKRTVETASAELEDGTLIELIEDPNDSARSQLAIFKDGMVRFANRFESENRIFIPIPRDTNLLRHVRLPRGVKPCGTARSLLSDTIKLLSQCLDLSDKNLTLLAHFIASTWFIERLPVAPYVALVGLPRSGKSTALTALGLLCRRALLTADITSAAFYRICDRLTPTLLIDETGTAGETKTLFHLLRTGTTREVTALRKDQSFKTFGPKAISWIELPDDAALNSRCIVIPLHETFRTDLLRPTSFEFRQAAEDLQKRFLQLRFEKINSLIPPKFHGFHRLHSRSRDLYEVLALPVGEDEEICKYLMGLLKAQEDSHRAPLSSRQSAVLQGLFMIMHQPRKNGQALVGDLAQLTNENLEAAGENFQVSPREVGAIMTSLGFTNRKRTNTGWTMHISSKEEQQVHSLVSAYGVEFPVGPSERDCRRHCDLCKQLPIREDS
jgi:hypothetical protein